MNRLLSLEGPSLQPLPADVRGSAMAVAAGEERSIIFTVVLAFVGVTVSVASALLFMAGAGAGAGRSLWVGSAGRYALSAAVWGRAACHTFHVWAGCPVSVGACAGGRPGCAAIPYCGNAQTRVLALPASGGRTNTKSGVVFLAYKRVR